MDPTGSNVDRFTGLTITDVTIQRLPPGNWLDRTDPYVSFRMDGNYNYESCPKFGNPNPHWENLNYVIEFPKDNPDAKLRVEVWDRNRVLHKDNLISSVEIPQAEIQRAPIYEPEHQELKKWMLQRALDPAGNITIYFQPLKYGNHPTPGSLGVEGYQWSNWGQNQHCMPRLLFRPKTKEDIKAIVMQAAAEKKRIRVAGTHHVFSHLPGDNHSWSPMTATDDYLIDCSLMRQVLWVDQMRGQALIESGCAISDLDPVLTKNGLCLPTNVVLTSVRYGGVIATGCHGPGKMNPTISDFVAEMTIIGYDGKEVTEKTYTQADGDLFNAIKVNLGCFGVIYSIKLQLPRLSNLLMKDTVVPLSKAMDPAFLKEVHEQNDYVELFWWPFNNEVWVKTWNKTESASETNQINETWGDVSQALSSEFGVSLLDLLGFKPSSTPGFCRFIWTMAKGVVVNQHHGEIVVPMPEALHFQRYIDTVRCFDTEYCVKVDPEYKNIASAWKVILDKINEYAAKELFPINIIVEIRVHGRSTSLISPSYSDKDEHHCYIEFLGYYKNPAFESISREISTVWINNPDLQARPHWAKMFQTVDKTILVPHLKKCFGENWDKWTNLRNQEDPTKMFLNPYVEDFFYGPY